MAVVTITGGPFTDGQGNPIPGSWQLQPVPSVGSLRDGMPLQAWGRLGDYSAPAAGEFSATVAEGTYLFTLRCAVQVIRTTVVVSYANGATQAIETLVG